MRKARTLQTTGLSLRSSCTVHQRAQTSRTPPFPLANVLLKQIPPFVPDVQEKALTPDAWTSTTRLHAELQARLPQLELPALQR